MPDAVPDAGPGLRRREALLGLGGLTAWGLSDVSQAAPSAEEAAGLKVLRLAFPVAETGFDPARVVDLYSRIITAHIFESLYTFDPLARPARLRPLIAADLPRHDADFKVWTVQLRPGIFFADDPAFRGRRREVVAQDFVYALKRFVDPANRSPAVAGVLEDRYLGLAELRDKALKTGKPFDYDTEIEGVRALGRHTLQFKLAESRPRFGDGLAANDLFGAVAREVVEHYGDELPAHPVGTGPFRLAQWRRSSLIVLARNPDYRELRYEAEPAADDVEGQAILKALQGRRLPMIDRVEVSVIEESQPRWIAFLNGQLDVIGVPAEYIPQALPGGELAPNLARQGIRASRSLNADCSVVTFNMEDPVVGGYEPAQVALRRAIGLSMDIEREIRVVRKGQAVPAQSIIVPHTSGYDPAFRSENGVYDPARAQAMLDVYGYRDRDGDGWRERPDGSPLVLEVSTQPDQVSRQFDELWKRNLQAIGVRVRFQIAQWPEQLKAARAGKFQIWAVGSSAAGTDGQGALARLYGPQAGSQNLARFRQDAFDAIYRRLLALPDGPERLALFRQAQLISLAYLPYKATVHRISTELVQHRLVGYRRPLFWQEWWHTVDIAPRPTGT